VQPVLGDPAVAGGLDQMTHRGPFRPLPFHDSVLHGKLNFWGKVQLFGRPSRGNRNSFEGMLLPVLYSSRVEDV